MVIVNLCEVVEERVFGGNDFEVTRLHSHFNSYRIVDEIKQNNGRGYVFIRSNNFPLFLPLNWLFVVSTISSLSR